MGRIEAPPRGAGNHAGWEYEMKITVHEVGATLEMAGKTYEAAQPGVEWWRCPSCCGQALLMYEGDGTMTAMNSAHLRCAKCGEIASEVEVKRITEFPLPADVEH